MQHLQLSGMERPIVILHGPDQLDQIAQVVGKGGDIIFDYVVSELDRLLLVCHTPVNFENAQPLDCWH